MFKYFKEKKESKLNELKEKEELKRLKKEEEKFIEDVQWLCADSFLSVYDSNRLFTDRENKFLYIRAKYDSVYFTSNGNGCIMITRVLSSEPFSVEIDGVKTSESEYLNRINNFKEAFISAIMSSYKEEFKALIEACSQEWVTNSAKDEIQESARKILTKIANEVLDETVGFITIEEDLETKGKEEKLMEAVRKITELSLEKGV